VIAVLGSVSLKMLFIVLALVCFGLSFFQVPRYNWQSGGFFFALLAFVV
jgi:uncharacterized membrane protein YobD (UPF0266 family)